ncbi:MAG: PAS domain-containing protein [Candidatus Aminicenantes bacterium]|nr:PAS domain-containing protein [Candidatus Aminicenantes bacterium]
MKDFKSVKKDFKSLFKDSRDALFIASGSGIILDVNQACLDMFGFSRVESLGKNVRDFYFRSEKPDILWEELQKNGSIKDFEKALQRKDGKQIYCLVSANIRKNRAGDILAIQGIIHDITGRKEVEDMLQKERNFISAILETTGALVVILDVDGRFLRLNHSFEKTTDYSIQDLIGEPFGKIITGPEELKSFKSIFNQVNSGNSPREFKCKIKTSSGKERLVVWSITALSQNDSVPEYIIISGIDITQLQQALNEVKTLSGLLPICARCKKVRDDSGYWSQIEEYIKEHSEADFSHGICPDCSRELYPDVFNRKKK